MADVFFGFRAPKNPKPDGWKRAYYGPEDIIVFRVPVDIELNLKMNRLLMADKWQHDT